MTNYQKADILVLEFDYEFVYNQLLTIALNHDNTITPEGDDVAWDFFQGSSLEDVIRYLADFGWRMNTVYDKIDIRYIKNPINMLHVAVFYRN